MKRAVHTRLLGDVAAATERLPFAQTRLQAMMREHDRGPAARAIARHFDIGGDTVDLWVDALGGRITIRAGSLGDIREYGMSYGQWRLFSQSTLIEVATRRVTLGDVAFPALYLPHDATADGFLGETADGLVVHDAAGAVLWTYEDLQVPPALLPGNPPFLGTDGRAFAGAFVVFADGTESKSQVIYEDYPSNLNVLGYQLEPSTLRYGRLDAETGANFQEAPTQTATVWGAEEAVFVPRMLAGAVPALPTFHAAGFLLGQGSDEETARLVLVRPELHHIDPTDLSTLGAVELPETPVDLVVDNEGVVYVRFRGTPASPSFFPAYFQAYTRDLVRVPEKDFNNIDFYDVAAGRGNVAIAAGYLFSKVEDTPGSGLWRLKKIDRAGTVVADVPIPFSLTSADDARLVLIRT